MPPSHPRPPSESLPPSTHPHLLGLRVLVALQPATIRYAGPVPLSSSAVWLGLEWDDPLRGKHDGAHNGVRYFWCRGGGGGHTATASAASFVKLNGNVKIDFGTGVVDALIQKYAIGVSVSDVDRVGASAGAGAYGDRDSNTNTPLDSTTDLDLPHDTTPGPDMDTGPDMGPGVGAWGGKEVELIGWRKTQRMVSQLHRLTEVGLAGARVAGLVAPVVSVSGSASASASASASVPDSASASAPALADLAPHIRSLDLSRNLLPTFATVAHITRRLSYLETLRLASNKFAPLTGSDEELRELKGGFECLLEVELGSTGVSWRDVRVLGNVMPRVREVYLGFNALGDFEGGGGRDTVERGGECGVASGEGVVLGNGVAALGTVAPGTIAPASNPAQSHPTLSPHPPPPPLPHLHLHPHPLATFPHLRLLNLEHNDIRFFPWSLAHLPTLESLALQRNRIEELEVPAGVGGGGGGAGAGAGGDGVDGGSVNGRARGITVTPPPHAAQPTAPTPAPTPPFPSLRALNISDNLLSSWLHISALSSFPSLIDLRLRRNPVLTSPPFPTLPAPPTPTSAEDDARATVLARVPGVKVLNGSEVGAVERRDAERWYVAKCAHEAALEAAVGGAVGSPPSTSTSTYTATPASTTPAPTASTLARHPRYLALCALHGPPDAPLSPAAAAGGGALKTRLLALRVRAEGKDAVERRVPPTMTVRALRGVVGKAVLPPQERVRRGWVVRARGGDGEWVALDDELREVRFYGVEDGWEVGVVWK
ncbi:RNI-like protein [Gonapodya prolifera JEL478]|uniref:RNI-like protein n=1 Tax=Gonapodya prolifera (strain JEL478) TaxID=1344416 RepID=A0A139AXS8_GONPJ|nr:RNI-like protein [Gonapodya prolifera JEL478]|eukprot:KXS21546.1 RNI-like protein [Gonapodya prolifera JEL478]